MSWKVANPIVVPFDFSLHAHAALLQAAKLAETPSQIHALHVLPYMIPTDPGVVWATIDDSERIRHVLENMQSEIKEPVLKSVQLDVRIGDPGHTIADRAEELAADLIVMGSHGRTGLTRFFLGSVTERVVRLAHCPVLVVKLPVPEAETATLHKHATT